MSHNEADKGQGEYNRRDFIKGTTTFGSLMMLMGGVPLMAKAEELKDTGFGTEDPPVSCGVIGCGVWGREIVQTLGGLTNAPVAAICDVYKPFLKKAQELAPKAEAFEDYHKLLEQKNVEVVVIATPTHTHREIVEACLKAGKHVYCEAPIASNIDDAIAIAKAAKAAEKLNFQTGLQMRSDPGKKFVLNFIHTGAVGIPTMARSHWHKRTPWRKAGPTPERDKALNWRLDSAISAGLAGEIGIHQFDLINWMLGKRPIAVTGFGGIMDPDLQQDGRDVADTIQCITQYPGKFNSVYDCTITNSFDGEVDVLYGTGAAIMLRPEVFGDPYTSAKAWLFEETGSQLFGWEIYAAKEQFYRDTGIALAADASKSVKKGQVTKESPYTVSTLHHALKAFVHNSLVTGRDAADFVKSYGADADGFGEYLSQPANLKKRLAAAGYKEGLEATITAIKANEAIVKGEKIMLPKELFEI